MARQPEAPSIEAAARWASIFVVAIVLSAVLSAHAQAQAQAAGTATHPNDAMPSVGQPKNDAPTENVTVTGTRSHEMIEGFVHQQAVAARLTGKMARWTDKICPTTIGVPPAVAKIITAQVKALAISVGAPVNSNDDCRANIEIVFTASPQALIDKLRERYDLLLGYADNSNERDRLSKVTRTIQAWYTTATEDLHGSSVVDSNKTIPAEINVPIREPSGVAYLIIRAPHGFTANTGSRLGDGLRSTFYNVIVVADPSKLLGYEYGTVADYIGFLALAQINPPDNCQSLASILNLLTPGCTPVNSVTENDLAYLRGLYKMSPGANIRGQEDEIAYRMEHDFQGR